MENDYEQIAKAIRPILGRIVIRPSTWESVSRGGIVLPETVRQNSIAGLVCALGQGPMMADGTIIPFETIGISVGDTVVTNYVAGTECEYMGITFRVIMFSEVHFVIDPAQGAELGNSLRYTPEYGVEKV